MAISSIPYSHRSPRRFGRYAGIAAVLLGVVSACAEPAATSGGAPAILTSELGQTSGLGQTSVLGQSSVLGQTSVLATVTSGTRDPVVPTTGSSGWPAATGVITHVSESCSSEDAAEELGHLAANEGRLVLAHVDPHPKGKELTEAKSSGDGGTMTFTLWTLSDAKTLSGTKGAPAEVMVLGGISAASTEIVDPLFVAFSVQKRALLLVIDLPTDEAGTPPLVMWSLPVVDDSVVLGWGCATQGDLPGTPYSGSITGWTGIDPAGRTIDTSLVAVDLDTFLDAAATKG